MNPNEAESVTKNKKWNASSLLSKLKPKRDKPLARAGSPGEREKRKEKRAPKSSPSATSLASTGSGSAVSPGGNPKVPENSRPEYSEKTAKSYRKRQSKSCKKRKTKNSTTAVRASKPTFRRKPRSDSKEKESTSTFEKEKPAPVNVEVLEKATSEFVDNWLGVKKLATKIDEQWDDIELVEVQDDAIQAFLANADRNQLEEIECLDVNRIRLERQNPGANDYIHASSVEVKDLPRKIILAQLPKTGPNFLEDFWSMVYQQNIHNIYLLCHPEESTRAAPDKFGEFFPLTMGHHEYYGQIWVHSRKVELATVETDERPNDVHVVEVLPEGCAESIMVTIHLCSYWPDGEVPTNRKKAAMTAGSVIGAADSYEHDPVAIVSKCGAGRAGTFLTLTACVNALKTGKVPNIKEIANSVRVQRPGAIDKESQFVFIYLAMLQFSLLHITNKDLKVKVEKLVKKLEKVTDEMDNEDTDEAT